MTIRESRNGIDKGFSITSRVIKPSDVEHKQNSPQNPSEVNPRRYLLLRQVEGRRVLSYERRIVTVGVSDGAAGVTDSGERIQDWVWKESIIRVRFTTDED